MTSGGFQLLSPPGVAVHEHGKQCTSIAECEPCCGQPCNPTQGCYCFVCFVCCGACVFSKLWATSLGMECGFVNHFIPWFLFYFLTIGMNIGASFFISFSFGIYLYYAAQVSVLLGFIWFVVLRTATRVNLRRMWNIGEPAVNIWDIFLVCCCCTSPCEACQEFRSVNISGWDWLSQIRSSGFLMTSGGFQLFRPPGVAVHEHGKEGFQGSYQQPPGYYAPPQQPNMKEENHY